MIDFIRNNYIWIEAVVVPIVLGILTFIIAVMKQSEHSQKFHDVNGDHNSFINGDIIQKKKNIHK